MIEKPISITKTYIDFKMAAEYIGKKLGFHLFWGPTEDGAEDYWVFLLDKLDIENGAFVKINSQLLDDPKHYAWANRITKTFIEEFGEDTDYYVWW